MKNQTKKRKTKQTITQTLTKKNILSIQYIAYFPEKIKTNLSIPKIKDTNQTTTFYEHTYLQLPDK